MKLRILTTLMGLGLGSALAMPVSAHGRDIYRESQRYRSSRPRISLDIHIGSAPRTHGYGYDGYGYSYSPRAYSHSYRSSRDYRYDARDYRCDSRAYDRGYYGYDDSRYDGYGTSYGDHHCR